MPLNPRHPVRKSPRLKGYDYAQEGAYFVTICTWNRVHLFGEVIDGDMRLNAYGDIVQACWDDLVRHYQNIELDAFVVMPNHVHGIVLITGKVVCGLGAGEDRAGEGHAGEGHAGEGHAGEDHAGEGHAGEGLRPSPAAPDARKSHGLTEIVRAFKSFSARRINERRGTPGAPIWQRSFHDHVIRNERAYSAIREYIRCNPARWTEDRHFAAEP